MIDIVSEYNQRVNILTKCRAGGNGWPVFVDVNLLEPIVPLRDARKAFARSRICDAARQVFFAQGYGVTTIEQIARAAGTKRPTLYTHFRDKEEILDAIATDYAVGLSAVIALVPGPLPSRREIDDWVKDVAGFVMAERVPTVLLSNVGDGEEAPMAIKRLGTMLIEVLAHRLPAFQVALSSDHPQARQAHAHAILVIRDLSWCCLQYVRYQAQGQGCEFLSVAGDQFYRFIRDFSGQRPIDPE